MEALSNKLDAKLQLLKLTRHKTEGVVDTAKVAKIRRHKQALQAIVQGVDEVKREVEQAKLEDGESLEKVGEWGRGIEEQIDVADDEIKILDKRVERMIAEMKENELARQREEQLKFERQQLELKVEYSKAKEAEPSKQSVKLLKLVITKYNGALENWLTFWNKFEAEIDKTDLPAVTKFAYLKELVEPRVIKGIDGLPFTSEGYQRAKHILKTNYGQTSEIINAYVENILELPVISGANPAKIHDF